MVDSADDSSADDWVVLDSSADDWVVLDSPADDDADDSLVLALSSGCFTPCSATGSDADADVLALSSATGPDADPDAEICSLHADDDEATLVLALSSACGTPCSATGSDDDAAFVLALSSATGSDDDDAAEISSLLADAAIADHDYDAEADADADDLYYLFAESDSVYVASDAEVDDPAPVPRPLSGLFYHPQPFKISYAAFDPDNTDTQTQIVPPPAGFFKAAVASTRGLVCFLGYGGYYYIVNPATSEQVCLPKPNLNHGPAEPLVVITFERDDDNHHVDGKDDDSRCFYRHYHVVVGFYTAPDNDDYYFESFSSRTWGWTVGKGTAQLETVNPESGVAALGSAFWRFTRDTEYAREVYILCFDPVSGYCHSVPAPEEVTQYAIWELCEMEGALSAACMDDPVSDVLVFDLYRARRDIQDGVAATPRPRGCFTSGDLMGRMHVQALRSQGKAEVVVWDKYAEEEEETKVLAVDLEGRTMRTTTSLPSGTSHWGPVIPYCQSLAAISPPGKEIAARAAGSEPAGRNGPQPETT